jgi:hypothetical protein
MGLSFTIAAGPRQRSHSHVRVPRDSWPHFTVPDSRLPEPGGLGPHNYIPQKQGGPITPPGTGFSFRRLLRLTRIRWRYSTPPLFRSPVYRLGTDRIENTTSNSSIVACVSVAAIRWFGCRGNVFTQPLRCNARLLWLHYSGFEPSCHNVYIYIHTHARTHIQFLFHFLENSTRFGTYCVYIVFT